MRGPWTDASPPLIARKQIRARLDSRAHWQPADMLAVQKDVYSELSHFLAGQMVAALDKKTAAKGSPPTLKAAPQSTSCAPGTGRWRREQRRPCWPCWLTTGSATPWRSERRRAIPKTTKRRYLAPEIVERLLRERPPDWFPDYDALLLKSLKEAVADGEKLQGSKISRWDYGQYNELKVENPVFGQLPLVGTYFNIGPTPMSGSPTTVKQTTRRLGPSLRMVVDLSNLDRSLINITTGESGNALSHHYMDQWDSYYAGQSFPMEFDQIQASSVLTVNPF